MDIRSLLLSFLFHGTLVAFACLGFDSWVTLSDSPITVDVVVESDTQEPCPTPPSITKEPSEKSGEPKPMPTFSPQNQVTPAPSEPTPAPKPAEKMPAEKEPAPQPSQTKPEKQDPDSIPLPTLKPKPKPTPPTPKPKPEPEIEKPKEPTPPKKEEKAAPARKQQVSQEQIQKDALSFEALLKNLQNIEATGNGSGGSTEGPKPISTTELTAVRQQIAKCWNIPASAQGAQDVIVEIRAQMSPDGMVQHASIVNRPFIATSSATYRIASESALRAILSPQCNPLKFPREKYAQWKDITLTFNPRELLK